eukprot:g14343.t1
MLHGLLDHVPAPLTASPRDLDFPDVLDLYLKHARFFAPRTVVRSLLGAGNVPTVRDFREEKDGGTFIGRGSFSVVHAAEWSGHRVAVKRFVFGTGAKAGGPGGGEPLTDEILAENEGEELAVRVLAQLTEAVDFLRNKMGASHHDLKRAHVLFDRTHREIRIIALGGMSSLAVGVLPDVVDSRSTAARSSPPKRGSSENHPLPHAHPLVVWTPTFAPEEFEEKAYSVIDGACEKASSYDIFSLANVFSELILGFNVIAKRYTTFCNAPHLANWQQHACLARRLPTVENSRRFSRRCGAECFLPMTKGCKRSKN